MLIALLDLFTILLNRLWTSSNIKIKLFVDYRYVNNSLNVELKFYESLYVMN